MMEGLKEISKKHVGKYKVTLFHHVIEKEKGGMSIHWGEKMLHHSGHVHKIHAERVYHSLKHESHVEDFLRRASQESHSHVGFGMGVKY